MTDLFIIIWVLIVVVVSWAVWDRDKIAPKSPKWELHLKRENRKD